MAEINARKDLSVWFVLCWGLFQSKQNQSSIHEIMYAM